MAKTGLIVAGFLILVISIVGYNIPLGVTAVNPNISLSIPVAVGICNSGIGQFGQALSGEAVKICSEWNNLLYGIYGAGLLGLLLIISGAAIPRISKKNESNYICGYCKYVAKSEIELHNHSLDCETYKKEINKEKHSALDILKERYAKGEVTNEEFDDMKKNLEK